MIRLKIGSIGGSWIVGEGSFCEGERFGRNGESDLRRWRIVRFLSLELVLLRSE